MILKLNLPEILLICFMSAILLLVLVASIISIGKRVKVGLKYKKPKLNENLMYSELFGGKDNILSSCCEMSRLTVEVKNLELVQLEKIKENGASGVLVVGNQIKCSFGEQASLINDYINEEIK